MSADAPSYPADAGAQTFLLTVRGTTNPATLEASRDLHNATAGEPQNAAGARALGDLSHNVYAPLDGGEGELLFIDYWNSVHGLGEFFSHPGVQAAATALFAERDGVVWAPAPGFGSWSLPVPFARTPSGIGLLRVAVNAIETAAAGFAAYSAATINTARGHGLVAHGTWARVPMPGESPIAEVIGVDVWSDAGKMNAYYALGIGFEHLGPHFAGTPASSTWRAAPGEWAEW
jgi:hypothetical protein